MIASGVLVSLAGSTIAFVGALGSRGHLRRNRWSGIRTRATRASDDAWAAAHRAGGPLLVAGGVAWIGAGVAISIGAGAVGWAVFALGFALVAAGGLTGDRVARQRLR